VFITGVRLSDRSPDEGLGSSIAAPRGSLRSSLSRRIESNDTDRSVDIIEGSETDRVAGIMEGTETDDTADAATVSSINKPLDTEAVPDTQGLLTYCVGFSPYWRPHYASCPFVCPSALSCASC